MYCPTQLTVWPRLVVCICILLKADSVSGYKGVGVHSGKSKPYKAQVQRDGKKKTLGYFATAEEAGSAEHREDTRGAGVCRRRRSRVKPRRSVEEAQGRGNRPHRLTSPFDLTV